MFYKNLILTFLNYEIETRLFIQNLPFLGSKGMILSFKMSET